MPKLAGKTKRVINLALILLSIFYAITRLPSVLYSFKASFDNLNFYIEEGMLGGFIIILLIAPFFGLFLTLVPLIITVGIYFLKRRDYEK
jgi:uncharacterized membrane protein